MKDAREQLDASRRLVAGIDPAEQRKAAKMVAATANCDNTFEPIAREWFKLNERTWVKSHSTKIIKRLERDVFPLIGGPWYAARRCSRSSLVADRYIPGMDDDAIARSIVSSFRQQSEPLLIAIDRGSDLVHGFNILLRRHRRNEGIEVGVRWRVVEVAVKVGDVSLTDTHEIQVYDDIRDESVGLDALL